MSEWIVIGKDSKATYYARKEDLEDIKEKLRRAKKLKKYLEENFPKKG